MSVCTSHAGSVPDRRYPQGRSPSPPGTARSTPRRLRAAGTSSGAATRCSSAPIANRRLFCRQEIRSGSCDACDPHRRGGCTHARAGPWASRIRPPRCATGRRVRLAGMAIGESTGGQHPRRRSARGTRRRPCRRSARTPDGGDHGGTGSRRDRRARGGDPHPAAPRSGQRSAARRSTVRDPLLPRSVGWAEHDAGSRVALARHAGTPWAASDPRRRHSCDRRREGGPSVGRPRACRGAQHHFCGPART
jgi:hypothetical protein